MCVVGVGAVDAAVSIGQDNAPFCVNADVVKIQKIARVYWSCWATKAGKTDFTSLDWIVWRGVNQDIGIAAIIGRGDVEVPDAVEIQV